MTPEQNAARAEQAAGGMADFMGKLTEAVEQHQRGQKDPEEPWDELDYEKFMKECDARTEKHMELLDKYGDSPEAEAKIAKQSFHISSLVPVTLKNCGGRTDPQRKCKHSHRCEPKVFPQLPAEHTGRLGSVRSCMHIRHQFLQFFFRHDFAVEQVHFALGVFSKARIVRDHANRRALTV